jgi:hypothetical protein
LRRATADGSHPAERDVGKATGDFSRKDGGDGKDKLSGISPGRVLGAAADQADGDNVRDDVRQQLHQKWESEKKLQKRVTVLEKRLQEKIEEVEDLTAQLKKARDTAQAALSAKDEMSRKMEKGQTQAASSAKQVRPRLLSTYGIYDYFAMRDMPGLSIQNYRGFVCLLSRMGIERLRR